MPERSPIARNGRSGGLSAVVIADGRLGRNLLRPGVRRYPAIGLDRQVVGEPTPSGRTKFAVRSLSDRSFGMNALASSP